MHASDPVNRLMTAAVLTVGIDDPAGEVLRLFAAYPVHHLPVLDQQKVVSMLSSANVMKLEMFLPKGGKSPIEYLNERMKVRALLLGIITTTDIVHAVLGGHEAVQGQASGSEPQRIRMNGQELEQAMAAALCKTFEAIGVAEERGYPEAVRR